MSRLMSASRFLRLKIILRWISRDCDRIAGPICRILVPAKNSIGQLSMKSAILSHDRTTAFGLEEELRGRRSSQHVERVRISEKSSYHRPFHNNEM